MFFYVHGTLSQGSGLSAQAGANRTGKDTAPNSVTWLFLAAAFLHPRFSDVVVDVLDSIDS